jgi:hypothetical protein
MLLQYLVLDQWQLWCFPSGKFIEMF